MNARSDMVTAIRNAIRNQPFAGQYYCINLYETTMGTSLWTETNAREPAHPRSSSANDTVRVDSESELPELPAIAAVRAPGAAVSVWTGEPERTRLSAEARVKVRSIN
jgi:hypothetical protein